MIIKQFGFNRETKAFSHKNKNKMGQRVPLMDSTRGRKGEEGEPLTRIEKVDEERVIIH